MVKKVLFILFLMTISFASKAATIVIEDEETETFLYEIIKPIYETAGIPFDKNKIHIILDDSVNAFVSNGNHLFVHTGLITSAKNSNELSGVFAHEAGHIKAGHLFKQKLKTQELQKVSLASMVLAGLAGVASGSGEVAAAGIYGAQGALMGSFLEYKKEDERAADNFAVDVLKKNNIPNQGLLDFLTRLKQDQQLQGITERSYYTTHPLTSERIGFLENQKTVGGLKEDNRLQIVQDKLTAFIMPPKEAVKKYYNKNNYAVAIALFKGLKFKESLQYIDALIKEEPSNPYYHELKGQILYETAEPQKAAEQYQKALDLLPKSTNYKIYLASSLIEGFDDENNMQKAVKLLKQANVENKNLGNYLLLARAYGKLGDNANALIASSESSLLLGNEKLARKQAHQAKELSSDPSLQLRADDIIGDETKNNKKEKKSKKRYR